ncbi:MAG TPA: glycogen debranching protein GlgX [Acidiferrobacteraceae bacterium]|nr:glycogen debranching protein GlgX [Acidiferrobacteraceae bacterium]
MATPDIHPGAPAPLGATWDGEGVNFALYSEHAERVQLCLFDRAGRREVAQIDLPERSHYVWHGYLPAARPGLLYGYRVFGPYDPGRGLRFNPNKLLIDPYAKALLGTIAWSDAHFGYRAGAEDTTFDRRNSAAGTPRCVVVDTAFTWGDDRPPAIPWEETIIYEAHVKGFTALHPEVPPELRGTFAGMASEPVIRYLQQLGITAVELMPIHAFLDDRRLVERGLANYWGYNTIGYFAPHLPYSASGQIHEFKTLVKRLHKAGIEVLLDVVYNHTAEGNQVGPTLSFRGIDNTTYYRLDHDQRYYYDVTGCGNTLNMAHPKVLKLIMDSLRYWVEEMHVDGFRFDLASTLGREFEGVDRGAAFFDIIQQDPVLSRVKLIAEPWDLGDRGYQLGNFPAGWSEWNGRYRDAVRAYWRGDPAFAGEFASRLSGSSDLYKSRDRTPQASVNFVTVHDGFTLADLVSYNDKHNEANLEGNRDGASHNLSWNCGVEGPTDDPQVLALRKRQQRNLLLTLFLSQGVPLLLAGDEIGRTQGGNNNAYCQDNAVSWIDWGAADTELREFVTALIALRRRHRVFRRRSFFIGAQADTTDIRWLSVDGVDLGEEDWVRPAQLPLGVLLAGAAAEAGDDDFLLLFNPTGRAVRFVLPGSAPQWQPALPPLHQPVSSPLELGAHDAIALRRAR